MLSLFLFALSLSLVQSRLVQWTGAGGNPLWNNPGNWDCSCLPTLDDDVKIDHQNGNVIVGGVAAALAKSLTVGGSSGYPQVLTLTTSLNIGSGASTLNTNGAIILKGPPEQPLLNGGAFTVHGNGFSFSSGTLSGSGSFLFDTDSIFNLTDSASKAINTTVTVKGKAITHTDRSTNLVLNGATVTISGSLISTSELTIATDASSKFHVTGSFAYTGNTLLLQGPGFLFQSWTIGEGATITITNTFKSGTLDIGSGSTLTLIGAPTESRTFTTITGSGTILNQGGVNTFNTVAANALQASGGTASVTAGTFNSLTLTGAFLGGAKLTTQSAELTTGFINGGLKLSTQSLVLQGTVEIDDDGTTLSVSGTAQVPVSSLVTMTGGSMLQFAAGSTTTQSATLSVVPGAPKANKPSVSIAGSFTSNAVFSVAEIPVVGGGVYTLSASGSLTFNNVAFTGQSIASQGTIIAQIGTFTADTISGSGSITAAPVSFNVNHLTGNSFQLLSGNVNISNLTLTTLDMKNGVFGLSTTGKLNTWTFEGGQFKGTGTAQAVLTVRDTTLTGVTTQTLTNTAVTTKTFNMDCGAQACQYFSQQSSIRTSTTAK